MLTVNSEVKKIYGKTVGKIHSKTGVSPIEFNSNNQGLISWSMLGNGEQASSQTYSLTEQPPISFNADGNPLASWSMLGNGQQSGTPTPDNPIMPEFVGTLDNTDWTIPITCAGQTVPVYLGQTRTVRKVKKLVLTGEEGWSRHTDTGTLVLAVSGSDAAYLISGEVTCMCTHYPAQNNTSSYSQMVDKTICMRANSSNIWIRDTDYSTSTEFKAYLAQQYANGTPVTVWYVLATPETALVNEPLCKIGDYADELYSSDTTVTIPTQNGPNTLTIGSTLQPSSMTITTASSVYPKNPIMPEFCGERTGNLCGLSGDNTIIYSVAYNRFNVSGNTINITGNALFGFIVRVTPQTAYTLSAKSSDTRINMRVREYTGKPTEWAGDNFIQQDFSVQTNQSQSFTTTATAQYILVAFYAEASFAPATIYDVMLNPGSTAQTYEPFGYKIPVTNAGTTTNIYTLEPLRKIEDYADVVGSTGTVTRKICKWILTGQETGWTMTTASGITVARRALPYAPKISDGKAVPIVCTHYVGQLSNDSGKAYISNNGQWIQFSDSTNATDEATWTAYLSAKYSAGTPVTVWYVLATPTTEQTTAPTIPTQNGANTISVDTAVPPSSLTIQYTSPDISEIARAVDGQGKPLYGPRYGFKIDKSQTDSASAIIYTHDAVTMTPAYMDYANGSFNYGSWGDIWFVKEAKPVALNLDGTIAYYLDPDDYTKKIDGTNSDIFYTLLTTEPSDWSTQWKQYYHLDNGEYVLNDDAEAPTFAANTYYKLETSFTGNFMVQFPKVYFKRYEDANYNYVEVSDRKIGRDFKAYAHLNANGDELDFIYLPMFKGVIQSSKLRSIPGVIPQGGTTASTEVTAAEACGTGWQIWDHSSREMINDLLTLMSKNADGQAKFGKGRESGYNASDTVTYGKLQTGTLIKKGSFYGYSTSYSDVKVFHIEGSWANRYERLQGLLLVDGVYKIKMAPPYNFTGTDFVTLTTAPPTSNNYVRTLATSEYGSVTATVSAQSSSPFKAYFYQYQSETRAGIVGGHCNSGSSCGPRCVNLSNTASNSGWNLGASAIYKLST